MRLINADKIIEYLDYVKGHADKYAFVGVEDILKIIENQPEVKAIVIPPNSTNGDAINAIFPDAQIDYHEKSDLVDEYVTVSLKDCDTCQDYSYGWWSTIYNKQQEEVKK